MGEETREEEGVGDENVERIEDVEGEDSIVGDGVVERVREGEEDGVGDGESAGLRGRGIRRER